MTIYSLCRFIIRSDIQEFLSNINSVALYSHDTFLDAITHGEKVLLVDDRLLECFTKLLWPVDLMTVLPEKRTNKGTDPSVVVEAREIPDPYVVYMASAACFRNSQNQLTDLNRVLNTPEMYYY